ncbi:HAD-IB family phosphatase [Candidatus Vidania fulgoroideorum]
MNLYIFDFDKTITNIDFEFFFYNYVNKNYINLYNKFAKKNLNIFKYIYKLSKYYKYQKNIINNFLLKIINKKVLLILSKLIKKNIVICTSSTNLLLNKIKNILNIKNIISTKIFFKKKIVYIINNYKKNKKKYINSFFKKFKNIYFFTDSIKDIKLLNISKYKIIINPCKKLNKVGYKKGWIFI